MNLKKKPQSTQIISSVIHETAKNIDLINRAGDKSTGLDDYSAGPS